MMKLCKTAGIALGMALFSHLACSEESFQVISIPVNQLIRYDRPPSIREIIRMATDLSRNEKTIVVYLVKEKLPGELLLDKNPLISSADVKGMDVFNGRIRIRLCKNGLDAWNDTLRNNAPPAHPPQVVIAYKGAFYFSPYVSLPIHEEMGLRLPAWLPQEIFNWPQGSTCEDRAGAETTRY